MERKENVQQIKKDLSRTYPTCKYFAEQGPGQRAMENVLLAYAKYDTQVGYVQGMNFVVAALLYHCSEEVAFWLFVTLLEDYEIRDVYLAGLPGLYRHTHIIGSLLQRNFRELTEHLVIVEGG